MITALYFPLDRNHSIMDAGIKNKAVCLFLKAALWTDGF